MATIKSIEEKAKAYDEALKKAKDMLSYKEVRQEDIEYLFPELKESEDERIRKEIIDILDSYDVAHLKAAGLSSRIPEYIAWLEKQGEQKQPKELTNSEFVEKCKGLSRLEQHILALVPTRPIDAIKVDARTIRYLVEQEQGEQKPIDDVKVLNQEFWRGYKYGEEQRFGKYADCNIEEMPVEWSEEDERWLDNAIVSCEQCGNTDTADWLKSLRPQNTWKPSDEQMDALRYVTNFDYGGHKATLVSLYEQLKKLK